MGRSHRHFRTNQAPHDPYDATLKAKKSKLLRAEREYWAQHRDLREQQRNLAGLSGETEPEIPADISSTVWALRDGAVFVRYKSTGTAGVGFRTANMTLEQWGNEGRFVPLIDREISLAQMGFHGLGHLIISNATINGILVPYAELSCMRYSDEHGLPSVERAIVDYQLTLMGLMFRRQDLPRSEAITPASVIEKLEAKAAEFEGLLAVPETKEEQVQKFIRDNPFIIHPAAQLIPKQRLGEDFVTDFVLVAPYDQGPVFYFVEIERASHPVLVKDGTLSGPANHALKQTRDWSIWLEANQGYLKNKLPGLESPRFLIVIGRSTGLSEVDRAYLRAYNREWKNTSLYTYDDLLTQFRATIARLREISVQ